MEIVQQLICLQIGKEIKLDILQEYYIEHQCAQKLVSILFGFLMVLHQNRNIKNQKEEEKTKQKAQQKMEEVLSGLQGSGITAGSALLKYSQRTVRITSQEKLDAMKLITYLGMPIIEASSQAEPQCAWLVKNSYANAVVSQDMDTLVYGAEKLIRGFTKKNLEIINQQGQTETYQLTLSKILSQLQLTYSQFVDFCILCGCDYTPKIDKIGPINAYKYIKEYKNIDNILEFIASDSKLRNRHQIPQNFNHLRARSLFMKPDVKNQQMLIQELLSNPKILKSPTESLKEYLLNPRPIQQQNLRKFLLQKQFNIARIQNWLKKANFYRERSKK